MRSRGPPCERHALGCQPPHQVVIVVGQPIDSGHRPVHRLLGRLGGQQAVVEGAQQLADVSQFRP